MDFYCVECKSALPTMFCVADMIKSGVRPHLPGEIEVLESWTLRERYVVTSALKKCRSSVICPKCGGETGIFAPYELKDKRMSLDEKAAVVPNQKQRWMARKCMTLNGFGGKEHGA